ncbi:SufE family protein [Marinomonas sp. 15G1-11]|uniref:SufE family protein n=1 Tax=Marinomonas phaeophyticola TaxID=3004091 RepID=A0ABT4JYH5_9GAMM|nr:SufE family protein [Marinomonas sp. 15G1-11]MCZ2723122.1 SufE family protein [Marinomonas sp. 15G1-11]
MSLPTKEEIIEDLEFFDDWEDRYKYIIDLGKMLTPFDPSLRTNERLVRGCQSNVWIDFDKEGESLLFKVDSDAIIVKGLLALVMVAFDKKTPAEIVVFDIDGFFAELDLESHLSPTRGNGLKAIVAKIQVIAKNANL